MGTLLSSNPIVFLWESVHLCLKCLEKETIFSPKWIQMVFWRWFTKAKCEQSPSTNPSHSGCYLYPNIDSISFQGILCLKIMGCPESCYLARHHTVDGRNPANQLRLVVQCFFLHPRWCRISEPSTVSYKTRIVVFNKWGSPQGANPAYLWGLLTMADSLNKHKFQNPKRLLQKITQSDFQLSMELLISRTVPSFMKHD